ncbi:hypothetical protein GIB67_020042 [Kingdonia uniflora]|uniref:Uncharacterized protein n=1 Tax=Kingdonia uniflora TaxID=39325 RepID=A0A7J7N4E0_9MAGN|nr:hypothetical protein GIB67_020042 [Kingdonia uniflora]
MVSTSGCAKANKVGLVGCLSSIIEVGDKEDIVAELVKWPHLKGSQVEYPMGCSRFREISQFDYGLTLPLRYLAKSVINMIGACPTQLNCNFWEIILVCETLNERWAASGSKSRITAKHFLKYYAVKYVTATDGTYLSSSSSIPCIFDLSSAGRVWNDNLLWMSGECLQRSDEEPLELNNRTIIKGISYKVLRKESFIDYVSKEGTELEVVLKKLGINRFKMVASKDDKVRRSQVKRRIAGKTPGSMEDNMLTLELNTPLKLAQLNKMPDGPVDIATVSSTVVQNLAKRKAMKRGAASRSATSDSVDDSSKRRKVTSPKKSQVVLEESAKIAEGADLRPRFEVKTGLMEKQCRAKAREKGVTVVEGEFKKLELEKEREVAALKLKEGRAESVAEAERLVSVFTTSRNNLAGKLYQLRYTKAEILAFSEGNYEEKEIMDKEEVEEMEDGLNVAEKTVADNQETIDQEIESLCPRVVDLEGLLEVEKNSSADLQLFLKLEEAKSQVEDKTATLSSKDLALNQLISELPELKERTASGSRHDAELAEYRIRVLNDEISDMKCNIRALNEQLLKREVDLDTRRTNLVVSEANFEKLSSSIVGKDLELCNSAQIRNSLIARLDHLKADLRCLKEREAQSRADLAKVQAKNKSCVDDLAHVQGNVRRAVQRDKEMNERINQLCARITKLEQELRAREMKYEKDLKLELDKRKSIDLTRQMSKCIDQLNAELAKSKAYHLRDNKRVAVTHQSFKELVVHEQEKCDGEALFQQKLSALVAFFVEEIKFMQVERDLMQDCFFGRTCVCKLDISGIDPIGVMDHGIGIITAEQIARGREIVAERAPEYMASKTVIGGNSSPVSPTPAVGGRSTALPSRKSSIIKKK